MSNGSNREDLIADIIAREWAFFQETQNMGGRAVCQDSPNTFALMRRSQFLSWSGETLASYLADLKDAQDEGRNPVAEKYGHMMRWTHPDEYARIENLLPPIPAASRALAEEIVAINLPWEEECDRTYPHMRSGGRPLRSEQDRDGWTSFETYLRGELCSYSERTLRSLLADCREAQACGRNPAAENLDVMARGYGYASAADYEERAARRARGQG